MTVNSKMMIQFRYDDIRQASATGAALLDLRTTDVSTPDGDSK
jgi:hypothetical protein